jgi:hypothetical protein
MYVAGGLLRSLVTVEMLVSRHLLDSNFFYGILINVSFGEWEKIPPL